MKYTVQNDWQFYNLHFTNTRGIQSGNDCEAVWQILSGSAVLQAIKMFCIQMFAIFPQCSEFFNVIKCHLVHLATSQPQNYHANILQCQGGIKGESVLVGLGQSWKHATTCEMRNENFSSSITPQGDPKLTNL